MVLRAVSREAAGSVVYTEPTNTVTIVQEETIGAI